MVAMEMTGEREAVEKLHRLAVAAQTVILDRAAAAGAAVLVDPIRQAAPRASGELADSTASVVRKYRGSGSVMAVVGPSYPRGRHGIIIEKGTQPRYTRKGYYRGSGPARPYAEPTYRENESRVRDVIAASVATDIEAEAAR